MRKHRLITKILIIALFVAFAIYSVTVYMSRRAREKYPVRGVDVSSYQGDIDWKTLAKNDIDFAFIKATEGSSYRDRCFDKNIKEANKTHLAVGAYHFMSFESDGRSQAQNFISAVDDNKLDLHPVIDLELYGKYNSSPPSAAEVRQILDGLVSELYASYGKMPIIYTNRRAYALYVSGEYKQCDIWICDIVKKPTLSDGRDWTFWQYSHTGKLSGYDGDEEYIDMNVFAGSRSDFKKYLK